MHIILKTQPPNSRHLLTTLVCYSEHLAQEKMLSDLCIILSRRKQTEAIQN